MGVAKREPRLSIVYILWTHPLSNSDKFVSKEFMRKYIHVAKVLKVLLLSLFESYLYLFCSVL